METELPHPDEVSLNGLVDIWATAQAAMQEGKTRMLSPNAHKIPPTWSLGDLAQVYGEDYDKLRKRLAYKASRGGSDLPVGWFKSPDGELTPNDGSTKGRVVYKLAEVALIVKALFPDWVRPDGVDGVVVTICNYKGGVTKSTSTLAFAQVLSLRGLKVLVIDLDSQATTTKWLVTKHVREEDSCIKIFAEQAGSLKDYIMPTYWPGIDVIPAHDLIQTAESHYHNLLTNVGPESVQYFPKEVRKLCSEYDVILIDTPPSLNNLTLSALFSSDGLVMPIVPSNPDIESASNFWRLYIDTCKALGVSGDAVLFQFVRILISKADMALSSTQNMINWIQESYPGKVMKTHITKTAAVARAADSFGTVFDEAKDLTRSAKVARDQMRSLYISGAAELAQLIYTCWDKAKAKQPTPATSV
ncbi:AAA family ATPase [Comamonas sp. w2-DMI]|uniref:ParA family protein n=1 Tax=Comamonas sp. w2-DMI TaxID=3126391 RepID=UPI0032E390D7